MRRVKAVVRGAAALILFGLFGLGGIALSPLMIVLRSPRRCQPVVRALWIPLVALFKMFGIISVTADKSLRSLRGCVIAANHPSLIDVVLITALVPRTLFVAKASLLRNPFMAAVVRNTSLPVDEHLPEEAVSYLAEGWNILIFPEGTRSPVQGDMHPFRRGVAQLVLRTGVPLVCLGIGVSRRILAKGQPPWDVGAERVRYSFRSDVQKSCGIDSSRALRPQAVALTEEIRHRIDVLRASAG